MDTKPAPVNMRSDLGGREIVESTGPRLALSQRPYRSIRQIRFSDCNVWPPRNNGARTAKPPWPRRVQGRYTENTETASGPDHPIEFG